MSQLADSIVYVYQELGERIEELDERLDICCSSRSKKEKWELVGRINGLMEAQHLLKKYVIQSCCDDGFEPMEDLME